MSSIGQGSPEYKYCGMLKVLMLDMPNIERIAKNIFIVLVATYVTNICITRKIELSPIAAIKLLESKIMYSKFINLQRMTEL